MTSMEIYLLATAVLLILCVFASKATGRLGMPTLVVFLGIGVLAGSEGIGKIEFNDASKAQSLGVLALAYILFSGGLDTKWSSIKPILKEGFFLSTLGVLSTCLLIGAFIHYILGLGALESFLIGAIVSSTDAGAVFTVLKSQAIHLKTPLKPLLEFESGSNDPMAVFLTTSILQMMEMGNLTLIDMLPLLFEQMILGGVVGYTGGKAISWLFNRLKLEIEGLYIVFSLAIVIFIYSLTQVFEGNGFLAVYIAGVILGNSNFVFKKTLTRMHDGISWLMQSAMFLTLGLLISPSQLLQVARPGIYISAFIIIFARPISVFLSLAFSKLSFQEKALVSWVGLRGSVPIVMATYPLVAGIDQADYIFNVVFFIALSSLIIQGMSIPIISKALKVDDPFGQTKQDYSSIRGFLKDIVTVVIPKNSWVLDKSIVDIGISPKNVLIVGIERRGEVIIPRGTTMLEGDDKVSVIADDEALGDFVELLYHPHDDKNHYSKSPS